MRGAFQRTHKPVCRKWKASAHGSLHKLQGGMKRTLCMQGKKFPVKCLCLTSPLITFLCGTWCIRSWRKIFSSCQRFFFLPMTFLAVLTLRFLCPNASKGTFQSTRRMNLFLYFASLITKLIIKAKCTIKYKYYFNHNNIIIFCFDNTFIKIVKKMHHKQSLKILKNVTFLKNLLYLLKQKHILL